MNQHTGEHSAALRLHSTYCTYTQMCTYTWLLQTGVQSMSCTHTGVQSMSYYTQVTGMHSTSYLCTGMTQCALF